MTNNNWNTVNWDEVPDDVDAVVTFAYDEPSYYKTVDGELQVQCFRDYSFECSSYRDTESAIEDCGDRFHLRPTPTSQPIVEPAPEPTESTQVESSEVEATTTPEFDWSSVEDDVEAVVVSLKGRFLAAFKEVPNHFLIGDGSGGWYVTSKANTIDKYPLEQLKTGDGIPIRRPLATTTPEDIGLNGAYDTYTKEVERIDIDMVSMKGTIHFKPDADMYDIFKGVESKPSIHTILQEAQQSILKHHGVTGKVKFTVTCS